MAKLERIWLNDAEKELRVDWDNDRHQLVPIRIDQKHPEPIALARAMREMADILEVEFLNDKL